MFDALTSRGSTVTLSILNPHHIGPVHTDIATTTAHLHRGRGLGSADWAVVCAVPVCSPLCLWTDAVASRQTPVGRLDVP